MRSTLTYTNCKTFIIFLVCFHKKKQLYLYMKFYIYKYTMYGDTK